MNLYIGIAAALTGVYAYTRFKDKLGNYLLKISENFSSPVANQSLKIQNEEKDTQSIVIETSKQLEESTKPKLSVIPIEKEETPAQKLQRWNDWKAKQKKEAAK